MDVLGKACRDKEESCGDGKLNFAEINDILTIANQVAEHSRQGRNDCIRYPTHGFHPVHTHYKRINVRFVNDV